jgi:hypothetical protein
MQRDSRPRGATRSGTVAARDSDVGKNLAERYGADGEVAGRPPEVCSRVLLESQILPMGSVLRGGACRQARATMAPYRCWAACAEVPRIVPMRAQDVLDGPPHLGHSRSLARIGIA